MEEVSVKSAAMKTRRGYLGVIIGILSMAAAILLVLIHMNQLSLVIALVGESEILLEFGEGYSEPGAVVRICGTLLFREGIPLPNIRLETESDLQETILGSYTVRYKAAYGNLTASAQRQVRVVDTVCPVITLDDVPDDILLEGMAYLYSGFSATDNYDGDITNRVSSRVDDGVVKYSVKDSSGNVGYAQRTLPTEDSIPPSIVLNGGDKITVPVGTYLEDPGFTASDNLDGDLTNRVTADGTVHWLIPGNYQIVYRVTDSSGNIASVTRSITLTALPRVEEQWPHGKAIYLTFEDGPGAYTMQLLDILDLYNIKATFFVTDSGYGDVMKEIVERGHSIGIHSAAHRYSEIYASPEAYFQDMKRMQQIIYDNTGVMTTLLRFPGGSSNTVSYYSYHGLMTFLAQAVQDAGFQYFDWNVDSADMEGAKTAQEVYQNVKTGISSHGVSAVLMRDTNRYSVDAVERIILWGLDNGYSFLPLTQNSPGFHHTIKN